MDHQREKELKEVMNWVTGRVQMYDVPRVNDIYEYSRQQGYTLSKRVIAKQLRLHPLYVLNMPQQRQPRRSQKYRPITVNSLGHLHADIGKFAVVREYETPISFQAGYLIAVDVLSRFTYVVILKKEKSAKALLKALEQLLDQHKEFHPDYALKSIAFDQEPGILSGPVQAFLKDNNISFHAFKYSSSKAKMAEANIRRIRTYYARIRQQKKDSDRWWRIMPSMVEAINNKEIIVDGKRTGFTPKSITSKNVGKFVAKLQSKIPAYFFSQYEISPSFVDFKFAVGMYVRPKIITTSSAVLGVKHSEKTLTDDVFKITELVPFITRAHTVGKGYKCINVDNGDIGTFYEDDIAAVPSDYKKN